MTPPVKGAIIEKKDIALELAVQFLNLMAHIGLIDKVAAKVLECFSYNSNTVTLREYRLLTLSTRSQTLRVGEAGNEVAVTID